MKVYVDLQSFSYDGATIILLIFRLRWSSLKPSAFRLNQLGSDSFPLLKVRASCADCP